MKTLFIQIMFTYFCILWSNSLSVTNFLKWFGNLWDIFDLKQNINAFYLELFYRNILILVKLTSIQTLFSSTFVESMKDQRIYRHISCKIVEENHHNIIRNRRPFKKEWNKMLYDVKSKNPAQMFSRFLSKIHSDASLILTA